MMLWASVCSAAVCAGVRCLVVVITIVRERLCHRSADGDVSVIVLWSRAQRREVIRVLPHPDTAPPVSNQLNEVPKHVVVTRIVRSVCMLCVC